MEYCHASNRLLSESFQFCWGRPSHCWRSCHTMRVGLLLSDLWSYDEKWLVLRNKCEVSRDKKGMKKKKENSSFMVALPPAVPICLSAHCSFSRLRLLKNAQLRLVRKNRHIHDYHYYGAPSSYDTPPSFPHIYFCIYHCVYLVCKYVIFILYVSPKF